MIVIELHYDCREEDLFQKEQLLKHQVKRKAFGNNEVDAVNDFINDCMISEMPNFEVKYINLN